MKASRRDVLRVVAGTSAEAVFGRLPGAGLSSVRGGGSSHPRLRPGADTNHRHAGPLAQTVARLRTDSRHRDSAVSGVTDADLFGG